MKGSTISARLTPRQYALIQAVAEAEGLDISEIVRRALFAFVWGNLEIVDLPTAEQPPPLLRLHDFPRIARSLDNAHQRDMDRLGIPTDTRPTCPSCGDKFPTVRGLNIHRTRKHGVAA